MPGAWHCLLGTPGNAQCAMPHGNERSEFYDLSELEMIRFIPFEFLFFLYIRSRFFNSPTSRVPRTKKLQGIRLPTGKFTFYNYFLLSFQNVTSLSNFWRNII